MLTWLLISLTISLYYFDVLLFLLFFSLVYTEHRKEKRCTWYDDAQISAKNCGSTKSSSSRVRTAWVHVSRPSDLCVFLWSFWVDVGFVLDLFCCQRDVQALQHRLSQNFELNQLNTSQKVWQHDWAFLVQHTDTHTQLSESLKRTRVHQPKNPNGKVNLSPFVGAFFCAFSL